MRVRYREEVANRSGPESCGGARKGAAEALTGETDRPGIEPRNQESGILTLLSEMESDTEQGANRNSCNSPAPSEIVSMSGTLLPRRWEISPVPVRDGARGGEGLQPQSRHPRGWAFGYGHITEEAAEERVWTCGGGGGKGRSQGQHRQDPPIRHAEPD